MSAEQGIRWPNPDALGRRKVVFIEVLVLASTRLSEVVSEFIKPYSANVRWFGANAYFPSLYPWFGTIPQEIARIALLYFFEWASGDSKAHFGLEFKWTRASTLSFFLGLLGAGGTIALFLHFYPLLKSGAETKWAMDMAPPLAIQISLILFGAIGGEMFFRGYLIPRLQELTGSIQAAIVLQALFYSLWCGTGLAIHFITGSIFGVVFLKSRSIWPAVAIHALVRIAFAWWIYQNPSYLS